MEVGDGINMYSNNSVLPIEGYFTNVEVFICNRPLNT